MADSAHVWTDKILEGMCKNIANIYTQAKIEITAEWQKYMIRKNAELSALQMQYDRAKLIGDRATANALKKELDAQKQSLTLYNRRYKELVDQFTTALSNVNQIALDYSNDQLPEIYTYNFNYISVDMEQLPISFSMIDEHTVKRLITDGDIQLPYKNINIPKDKLWNTKQLNSSVLQGILQGESMQKIAQRILPIVDNNENAAIRNARTMVTGAENHGRQDRYRALENDGAIMEKEWVATMDSRTRDLHANLDGTRVPVDDMFVDDHGNELEYPGDAGAEPETVYNCRCTMISHVVGFINSRGEEIYYEEDW